MKGQGNTTKGGRESAAPTNEILVKGRTIRIIAPLSLKQARGYYLPRFRRSHHYPSLTAAESAILRDALRHVRAVFSTFPSTDWVYEHFTQRGLEEREVALKMYEDKVKRMFSPSTWECQTSDVSVRLYEDVSSALYELAAGYAVPLSFVYSLALAKGILTIPALQKHDAIYLEGLINRFEQRIEEAKSWISRIDEFAGLPPYLRVATFFEPGKLYSTRAVSVLAMSVGAIHAGMPVSQRERVVWSIIDRLIGEEYLQEVTNRRDAYVCVKKYGEQTGGEECE